MADCATGLFTGDETSLDVNEVDGDAGDIGRCCSFLAEKEERVGTDEDGDTTDALWEGDPPTGGPTVTGMTALEEVEMGAGVQESEEKDNNERD